MGIEVLRCRHWRANKRKNVSIKVRFGRRQTGLFIFHNLLGVV